MRLLRYRALQAKRRLRELLWRGLGFRRRHGWMRFAIRLVCAWRWLPRLVMAPRRPSTVVKRDGMGFGALPFGVNIIGYSNFFSSFSEVVHLTAEALRLVDVPFVLAGREPHESWPANLPASDTNPYRFNLVIGDIAPVESPAGRLGRGYDRGRHNIALTVWEHEEVPEHLCKNLDNNVELWVPSSFVADAFNRCSSVPVVLVPHPMRPQARFADRPSELLADVPSEAFTFLFVFKYDGMSYGRKNPDAIVAAFKKAFAPGEGAALVIKSDPSARRALADLREQAGDHDGIHVLDASLSRDERDHLIASCDCYVSLHRSEGFGLTMAEAMAFGKPVIATRYSGNLEFMTEENSYLVDYELVRTPARYGPHRRGLLWAEPDIANAARLMRHVYEHRDEARRRGELGRADVRRLLSITEIGELMKERLLAIDQPQAAMGAAGFEPDTSRV